MLVLCYTNMFFISKKLNHFLSFKFNVQICYLYIPNFHFE